jgi:hypothetical protein
MPNIFTNEDYATIYDFCNGYGRAAVLEYWKYYSHHKTFETIHRILRKTGSFPHVNAEHQQQQRGESDVLAAVN